MSLAALGGPIRIIVSCLWLVLQQCFIACDVLCFFVLLGVQYHFLFSVYSMACSLFVFLFISFMEAILNICASAICSAALCPLFYNICA